MERRQFLKNAAAVAGGIGAAAVLPRSVLGANERVVLGVMGVRGRGRGLASGFAALPTARVKYVCDVDSRVLAGAARAVEGRQQSAPQLVSDFRRILEDREVDALVVDQRVHLPVFQDPPDHWHAMATLYACQAGKDVYVEKPISHNVVEGRRMVEAARYYRRVVQAGTQSRSGRHFQEAVEYLRSGKLGKVRVAKAINTQRRENIGKKTDGKAPEGVDYDMWLGPAPKRPFNENRFHYNWHWFWDYGTGDLGNDGVHQIDVARWGLGVAAPVAVTSSGGKLFFDDDQQTPDTQVATFEFDGCMLVYEMRLWSPYKEHGFENGNVFYGDEGYMLLGGNGWRVFGPNDQPGPTSMPTERDNTHLQNFIDCIKSRARPNADVEEGHLSSLLCHLGNIAHRTGRRIRFDPSRETIRDDRDASRLLTREFREPWTLPKVAG
jgi:predicted dehydrogenase